MTSQLESRRLKHTPLKENYMKRIENNIVETTHFFEELTQEFEVKNVDYVQISKKKRAP